MCDFGPYVAITMYTTVSSCLCLFGSVWGNTEQHMVPGMYSVFSSLLEIYCINLSRYGQNIIHAWLKWNGKTVSMIWFVVIMVTL